MTDAYSTRWRSVTQSNALQRRSDVVGVQGPAVVPVVAGVPQVRGGAVVQRPEGTHHRHRQPEQRGEAGACHRPMGGHDRRAVLGQATCDLQERDPHPFGEVGDGPALVAMLVETLCQQGELEIVTTPRAGWPSRGYRLVEGESSPGGES